jgi:hypothetical protein
MRSFDPGNDRQSGEGGTPPRDESSSGRGAEEIAQDSVKVRQLVLTGYDACFWRDPKHLLEFSALTSGPFYPGSDRTQEQRSVVKALTQLIDLLRLDTEGQDAESGLVSALDCSRSVICTDSDAFNALGPELVGLSEALREVILDERFKPAGALVAESETRIAVSIKAVSLLVLCHNLIFQADYISPKQVQSLQEVTLEGLCSALQVVGNDALEESADRMADYKLSLVRELGNLALCFPSTSFSDPLVQLSRICSVQCGQGSFFFPDIVDEEEAEWDDEYDSAEDESESWDESEPESEDEGFGAAEVEVTKSPGGPLETWRASMDFEGLGGEYEVITAVCLSALVYCQKDSCLKATWLHTLGKLEPQDIEWCSALVGLSFVDPDKIELYVRDLFDKLAVESSDKEVGKHSSENLLPDIAMNALLELLAGNEQSGQQVRAVYANLAAGEKKSIAQRVRVAVESGEAAMFGGFAQRERSLEDQLRFVFDLFDAEPSEGRP